MNMATALTARSTWRMAVKIILAIAAKACFDQFSANFCEATKLRLFQVVVGCGYMLNIKHL